MLERERVKNEREIRKMKVLLKRQHQELLEYDSEAYNIQLSSEEDPDVIDIGFDSGEEDVDGIDDDESNDTIFDESPFSGPSSATIDEEEYREHHQRSHNTAECRTLEISLQHIDEENEDLKDELNDQRYRFESDIDETRKTIADLRDRFDCIQYELKIEHSHFESAKAELEEVLDRERSKARDLEQQLLLARREQEILEQAAVEAQHRQQQQELQQRREQEILEQAAVEAQRRQQELQEQEEHDRQQELIERKEQDRKRQQVHQEQEEQLHQEELLRNYQELVELEKHQKQLDDVYFNLNNDNSIDGNINDNLVQNQNQNQNDSEQDVVAAYDGEDHRQHSNPSDPVSSTHSTQSTHFEQYDIGRQGVRRRRYQEHTFSVAVTTQLDDPRQSNTESKRDIRTNSHAHGIFMNFNDILF